jgi:hypothetical protein
MIQPDIRFPFPNEISPHAGRLNAAVNQILDDEYVFIEPQEREKYKRTNFGILIARAFPRTNEYERLLTIARYLLWATILEDNCADSSVREIMQVCEDVTCILTGGKWPQTENPVYRQIAVTREDILKYASADWLQEFAKHFEDYYQNGLVPAFTYSERSTFPPAPLFVLIRQRSIGSYPFLAMMHISTGKFFPATVIRNPIFIQIQTLMARMVAWENDIFSYRRKSELRKVYTNLVAVMQNKKDLSLNQAFDEAVKFHNADLKEFEILSKYLPDFGIFNEDVRQFLDNMGILLRGILSWYSSDTARYASV